MIELTGSDIEAIGRVLDSFGTRIMYECDEEMYRAGMRAGIERAHIAVGATEKTRGDHAHYHAAEAYEEGRDDAIDAIMAMLNPRA